MTRTRDVSELERAIIPAPKWSPFAWAFSMLAIAVSMACVIFLCRDTVTISILLGLLGIGYVICLCWLQFRCQNGYYANGLLLRKLFREVPILFDDIESYSLTRTRKTSLVTAYGKKEVYQFRIVIFLKEDRPLKKAAILFPEDDDRLTAFFDHLQHAVAGRMIRQYQREGKFDWTPGIRIANRGVESLEGEKHARTRAVFIPFDELAGAKFREMPRTRARCANLFWRVMEIFMLLFQPISSLLFGSTVRTPMEENVVLHLYRTGNSEAEITISCLLPNFHPGYDAFRQIACDERK